MVDTHQIVLFGRAHYCSYVSRFALRVRDRSANAAPNSEVHHNTSLAVDGMLAEALQMAEDANTRPGKIKLGGHRSQTRRVSPAQAL